MTCIVVSAAVAAEHYAVTFLWQNRGTCTKRIIISQAFLCFSSLPHLTAHLNCCRCRRCYCYNVQIECRRLSSLSPFPERYGRTSCSCSVYHWTPIVCSLCRHWRVHAVVHIVSLVCDRCVLHVRLPESDSSKLFFSSPFVPSFFVLCIFIVSSVCCRHGVTNAIYEIQIRWYKAGSWAALSKRNYS